MELDIPHLQQWIGRSEERTEAVTPALVERFNATFDLDAATGESAEAPVLIHLCLAPPAVPNKELGPDGHPARGGFLPPVPLPRRMWAGGSFRFLDNIRVGETLTRSSTIRDVNVKEGRSGVLCFVTVDHVITAEGRKVIEERQDIVFRGLDSGGAAKPVPAAAPGVHRETVVPSTALLFRYSALTFNGHRIHYDSPYVKTEEGYSGLIVHGPLQATLLAHLAARLRGTAPKTFDFRSLSPLFDTEDFTLNATEEDGGLRLWTSYAQGPVAMEARATW